ncbi:MAG TPA: M36 family metallopeptidase, partial [Prosthecobacter sp.]|nr:M36 family metallopeptidase [Prosthecobacter sp.]
MQASPGRVFDFPVDFTQPPSAYRNASVTQLFYWTNYAHDRLYELGFTEAAGNFQADNFGRGGLGNDPVNAEAQDGSGTNNANFSTPVDGGRGRMQMFLWTDPAPDRDGSFEAEIVLHEYCHGLSNRLVGGPSVTITALASQGLGEGWSDFYSLALTAEASDNVHANWARAGYTRHQSNGWMSENYYFGTRRYSYSTDMLKNPHTFKDIDPGKVDWHVNVARNPTYAATQDTTQVHYQGTVWCAMLWELRANLILKHGFGIGNERAMFLVTEGMRFSPANPNFVQARDGIIQATLVNHPADLGEVWTAFAKRGLGHGAKAPASSTTTGITESFTVPDGVEIQDKSGWNIAGDAGGSFAPAAKTVTLSNDGATAANWTVNPNTPWLSASPSEGTLAPGASTLVVLTTHADNVSPGFHSTNVVFTNVGTGFNQPVGVRLQVAPPVVAEFHLDADPGWTRTGEWAFGTPTGGGGGGTGSPDPTSGATGSTVFGVNLAGNHTTSIVGPHYLTMGPLNLSGQKKTRLRFMRWLNTNALANTRVSVEVSNDGISWRDVFVNPGAPITDKAWRQMEYDISSIADGQSQVYVRWGYRTLSSPGAYSGWNIDDVRILGESTAKLVFELPGSVSESSGTVPGILSLGTAQSQPVTVTVTSSDHTAATVPETVTFEPGEVRKSFVLTTVDDADVDGTQTATITASAPEVVSGTATVAVMDD